MIKKQLLTLITLCSLSFVGCNSTHTNKTNLVKDDNISLEVTLERNTSSPYPLDIVYKLTNLSNKTIYYNEFTIPYHHTGQTFYVKEDGNTLEYTGITAASSELYKYLPIQAGESIHFTTSLDNIYAIHKGTHLYEIYYEQFCVFAKWDKDAPENTGQCLNLKSNTLEFETTIHKIRTLRN